jgi:GrpB-like predicted nucleotidyltransferase (UPF0157 family)
MEHIGSTSVPGMAAKPQIDVLVTVKDLAKLKDFYNPLAVAGFTARGDYTGEGEEYFTQDGPEGLRLSSVHVLPEDHVWAADLLRVRDYLRAHPAEAKAYSDTKLQAAATHPDDYNAYYQAKLKVIQGIRQRAANWAKDREQ